VLGQDLATDLLGTVGFAELAYWLAARRRPEPGQLRMFETVLVALADHGFTPTAIAARLTLYSAPESMQGAIAAGLLGGGSRFLGVTEDTAAFLDRALRALPDGFTRTTQAWNGVARRAVHEAAERGDRIPGLGHPIHTEADPRVPALLSVARETGVYGDHLALVEAIGRVHETVLRRRLPLNGAGVGGAALADAGLPIRMMRGFALLARTAGLIGHLAEELATPIAPAIYAEVDRHTDYRPER